MKIGVIGLGVMGERHTTHLQRIYPRAHIDILTKRTHWEGAGVHTRLVTSPARFYAAKHELFLITNETGRHAGTILKCLAQKPKGIFVEKPLCTNMGEVARLRRALKNYKGVFFVGYCLHFFKPVVYLKKLVQNRTVGKVFGMRVSVGQDLRTWGKGGAHSGFRGKRAGGGAILDLIHDINYPAWILGQTLSYITGAYGRVSLPIEAEDISEAVFRSSGGVLVSIHQDYLQRPGSRSCEIFGESGTIRWSRLLRRGASDEIRVERVGTKTVRFVTPPARMYVEEVKYFVRQAAAGRRTSNFEEAAWDIKNTLSLKRRSARLQ